jgi:PPOX class probable F420-dependent enzyme
MAADKLPDPETPFGKMARERLVTEPLIWFTTVGKDGTPQPNPVWFLLDDGELLIYNRPDANRLNHIRTRPQVSLNLNSAEGGNGIVVITGLARVVPDAPPANAHQAYLGKYAERAARVSGDVDKFAAAYSVAVRVEITKVRGF